MFVLYNLLLLLASPVILAVLLAKKRCRPGLRQRLGWLPRDLDKSRDGRPTIWVHAVSLGETTAVVPLVQQLKTRYPAARGFVSTVTETGKETGLRRLAGQAGHLYFPRVVRTGNLKYDQVAASAQAHPGQISRHALRLTGREELFVAGSTHPGEEDAVLDCYRRLLDVAPALVLVLAPRHIERAEDVVKAVRSRGFTAVRRTKLPGASGVLITGPRVVILDTRGDLATLYRDATLVFVGGSLVNVGGHSPLEPAAWGKAVVFGPHMDHFAEAAEQLRACGAGVMVRDAHEMTQTMTSLLLDRSRLEAMGKAAYELVLENQGALVRTVALIARLVEGEHVSR